MTRKIFGMTAAAVLILLSAPAFAQNTGRGGGGGGGGGSGSDGRSTDVDAWAGAFHVEQRAANNPGGPNVRPPARRGRSADGTQSCITGIERFRARIGNTKDMLCRDS